MLTGVQTLTNDIIGVETSPSVEYVDAFRYRARASSSSSTRSSEEYFDAVEYEPASHSPRSFNVIPPETALSLSLKSSEPEFVPNPPAALVVKEWGVELGFFASSKRLHSLVFFLLSKTNT